MTGRSCYRFGARFWGLRVVYETLWTLALPVVLGRLIWRARRRGGYRQPLAERFGRVNVATEPAPIWVHAVSVGETVAAAPLIEALLAEGWPVWVSSTTPTGAARVQALFGDRVAASALPFDRTASVARFLHRVRPRAVVVMETELWPTLFAMCIRTGIPIGLANGRLSERSARRYGLARGLMAPILAQVSFIGAQTAADAARFQALGAPAARVRVAGNLKYDVRVPPDLVNRGQALRKRLGAAPIWLAASTHEGEERYVIAAHAKLRRRFPDLRLLLAPRHPERFDAVAALAREADGPVVRLSHAGADTVGAAIIVGDCMGELGICYAAVDLALIGGTLVAIGGHNLIEAAAVRCPMIVGPYRHKIPDLIAAFDGAFADLSEPQQLADTVRELMDDPERRRVMAERAHARLAAQRGATASILEDIKTAVGEPNIWAAAPQE